MKLRGLPVEIHPGPVELRFADEAIPLLQACSLCHNYNKRYLMCHRYHITCVECFLPDSPSIKLNRPQYEGYCRKCSTQVTMHCIEVPTMLLKNIRFICGCNFVGKLGEIKTHVKSNDFSKKCSKIEEEPVATSDEFDLTLARLRSQRDDASDDYMMQTLNIQDMLRAGIEETLEKSDTTSRAVSSRSSDSTLLNLSLLCNRLEQLKVDVKGLESRSKKATRVVQDRFPDFMDEQERRAEDLDPLVDHDIN